MRLTKILMPDGSWVPVRATFQTVADKRVDVRIEPLKEWPLASLLAPTRYFEHP
jgi:hypothetical protein